jgi:hypothetical protein
MPSGMRSPHHSRAELRTPENLQMSNHRCALHHSGSAPRERDMALEDAFASHHHAAFSSEIHFLTAIFTSLGGSALQAARIWSGFTFPCSLTSSTVATLSSPCLTG